ncbi:MAG: threonine ammonia-lyase IlvA [Alphaproteobacteria bacterium]|nr:threonine ammonia-lyase IlvA [Alphaproteobacteria bacterium]
MSYFYDIDIASAYKRLAGVVQKTPLVYNKNLSLKYQCDVFFKREDLQIVRSYKLRGAYNMIRSFNDDDLKRGIVCASAGNHSQGVAYSCNLLKTHGVIFMPAIAQKQKVNQTKQFGGDYVDVKLIGDNFDECYAEAKRYCEQNNKIFIPPFDDELIIAGQATVAVEIIEELNNPDYIFVPIGGGGLCAGVSHYIKNHSPKTIVVGVEPQGAPSLKEALAVGHPITLSKIDNFADGAAVKRTGNITFDILKENLGEHLVLIPEGKLCTIILQLYTQEAMVVEPAGSLSVAALDFYADRIKNKKVVCIISGSNNNIDRLQEIKERALVFEGLKHYFLINFAQRPGSLKEFVNKVLGPQDDITRFEYLQKNFRETAPAFIGIEVKSKEDYEQLIVNMNKYKIIYKQVEQDDLLMGYLV